MRFQIVALLLTLLVATSLIVSGVTAFYLHGFLVQRLDQQLTSAGERFANTLEEPNDHDADNAPQFGATEGQAAGTLIARVVNGGIAAAEVVPHDADDNRESAVSTADRAVLLTLRPAAHPRGVHLPDLGEYRVLVARGDDGDLLITGLPEHPVDDTIARLVLIELTVLAIAVAITGAVGAVCVRLSLRPLTRIARTARDVADLPLSTGTVSLPGPVTVTAARTEAGQVAEAFNHMLEHIESSLHHRHASEDRLRHFVADASHELRTPVAVVRSHAEFAQRVGSDLPAQVSEALTRITSEADRMGHLVDDLLLLARLDSGRTLEEAPVDLTRIVLDAVSDSRVTGPGHRWRLDLPEDAVEVTGDAHALHQVVANLLGNAREHTPAGSTVVTRLERTDEAVVLTVSDDGPGIPAGVLPRVFDRFVRADGARSSIDGSGLGLSIVAAIVAAHHGSVAAVSEPGDTRFTITLPGN